MTVEPQVNFIAMTTIYKINNHKPSAEHGLNMVWQERKKEKRKQKQRKNQVKKYEWK